MNLKISKLIVALLAIGTLAFASDAFAGNFMPGPAGYNDGQTFFGFFKRDRNNKERHRNRDRRQEPPQKRKSVPELDAAGAPIALALVGGIAGLAIERRRRIKKK